MLVGGYTGGPNGRREPKERAFTGIAEEGLKARASLSPPTGPEEGFG
jgi:hypothetical protein